MDALARGLSLAEVARTTGISRSTIRNWRDGRTRSLEASGDACPVCRQRCLPLNSDCAEPYAYLLGQYLGDGGIYEHRRKVFRLVIFGDARYGAVADDVANAMSAVAPHVRVLRQFRGSNRSVLAISAYSRRWPCLFPQHGSGPKHLRPIQLSEWQREITQAHPHALIRGLIHSDGCRAINTVTSKGRRYRYPRYQFCNRSDDIRAIFCEHLDLLGIPWRRMNRWNISVARREGVARLDEFVGPKR
jgi:hypothetical protein